LVRTFTRAVFVANFAEDREISNAEVLAEILSDLGRDSAAVTEASNAPTVSRQLNSDTKRL